MPPFGVRYERSSGCYGSLRLVGTVALGAPLTPSSVYMLGTTAAADLSPLPVITELTE